MKFKIIIFFIVKIPYIELFIEEDGKGGLYKFYRFYFPSIDP